MIKVLSDSSNETLSANYIVVGYNASDVNLDGQTIAAGPNNDINQILTTVFLHPGNSTYAANYIVTEQVP